MKRQLVTAVLAAVATATLAACGSSTPRHTAGKPPVCAGVMPPHATATQNQGQLLETDIRDCLQRRGQTFTSVQCVTLSPTNAGCIVKPTETSDRLLDITVVNGLYTARWF